MLELQGRTDNAALSVVGNDPILFTTWPMSIASHTPVPDSTLSSRTFVATRIAEYGYTLRRLS